MTKPDNCSAGGYCDCLQRLEDMGVWREDRTFCSLSLTNEQARAFAQLRMLGPGEATMEDLLATGASLLIQQWRTDKQKARTA